MENTSQELMHELLGVFRNWQWEWAKFEGLPFQKKPLSIEKFAKQLSEKYSVIKIEKQKTVLETGKWYKSESINGDVNRALFFITAIGEKYITAYGFDYNGNWSDSDGRFGKVKPVFARYIPATEEEEIKSALIAEAKKRGFVKGAELKGLLNKSGQMTGKSIMSTTDTFFLDPKYNLWVNVGVGANALIFENGKWASILPNEKQQAITEIRNLAKTHDIKLSEI